MQSAEHFIEFCSLFVYFFVVILYIINLGYDHSVYMGTAYKHPGGNVGQGQLVAMKVTSHFLLPSIY